MDVEDPEQTTTVVKYIFRVGKTKFVFADTPGHQSFRDLLELELKALIAGKYQGVINVVAYGYNQSKHHKGLLDKYNPHRPLLETGEVNPKYVAAERKYEIEYLNNWITLIGEDASLRWVITVPNKAVGVCT